MSKRPEWWLTVLAKIWPITWLSARWTQLPLLGPIVKVLALPTFSKKNLNITYIPINRSISGAESTFLPSRVVEELINRSSHWAIIKRCTCRDAVKCREHPIDCGCIFLGEGAGEIDPRIARHVTAEEAISHLRRALDDGLIPLIGRVKIDNYIWGVRDRGKLLTICLCCRCCCTILNSGKYLPHEAADSLVRLKGLRIGIDPDRCNRCEGCVQECFMGAMALEDEVLHWDENRCKGCGRCVSVCPERALHAEVEDLDAAIDEVMGRITRIIDIR
jgi:Pyruvate/2-oxoacid:ferredoxin oxidoreductase delta subunit